MNNSGDRRLFLTTVLVALGAPALVLTQPVSKAAMQITGEEWLGEGDGYEVYRCVGRYGALETCVIIPVPIGTCLKYDASEVVRAYAADIAYRRFASGDLTLPSGATA